MERYDPDSAPDAGEWLELDEQERMKLVSRFHRDAKIKLPNRDAHAMVHVMVENQAALGVDPVPETLERLEEEGLDRHEAVHAVGTVLMQFTTDFMTSGASNPDMDEYTRRLERLTAKRWRKGQWS